MYLPTHYAIALFTFILVESTALFVYTLIGLIKSNPLPYLIAPGPQPPYPYGSYNSYGAPPDTQRMQHGGALMPPAQTITMTQVVTSTVRVLAGKGQRTQLAAEGGGSTVGLVMPHLGSGSSGIPMNTLTVATSTPSSTPTSGQNGSSDASPSPSSAPNDSDDGDDSDTENSNPSSTPTSSFTVPPGATMVISTKVLQTTLSAAPQSTPVTVVTSFVSPSPTGS